LQRKVGEFTEPKKSENFWKWRNRLNENKLAKKRKNGHFSAKNTSSSKNQHARAHKTA